MIPGPPADDSSNAAAIEEAAARWIVRRDRGLSATEVIEFELWLAADERHAAAFADLGGAWTRLDPIPDDVARDALLSGARERRLRRRNLFFSVGGALAAAAAVAVLFFFPGKPASPAAAGKPPGSELASQQPRVLTLRDGTFVRLNAGGIIVEQFTPAERRVQLVSGEAHFIVAKDPAHPFVVQAGHVAVRAVGTAFGVALQSSAVEVLVTEGSVKLDPSSNPGRPTQETAVVRELPVLTSGHRAVIALKPVSPEAAAVITTVDAAELSRALAWHEPLVRLGGATLAEIAASFERRTGRRVVFADPTLAELRVGGRVRADDVEDFTSALEAMLDIEAERSADGTLRLRKKNSRLP